MEALRLSSEKTTILQELILDLYSRPFDDALILEAAKKTCTIMDSHYFSLNLFGSRRKQAPRIISNNPRDYVPVYLAVRDRDYILESLVASGGDRVLSRLPDYRQPSHRDFNETVLPARPIADLIYYPIESEGELRGLWSIAKAGRLGSPAYEDDEIAAFRFISAFLNDAFKRSFLPPPVDEDLAYLDHGGRVVGAGARIKAAFDELFRRGGALAEDRERAEREAAFRRSYRRFLGRPQAVGMDRIALSSGESRYAFAFSPLRSADSQLRQPGLPFAIVRLLKSELASARASTLSSLSSIGRFALTPRELEVLHGIFAGKSNKRIAAEMNVDEGTVKRHTHGIYEKTGFRSRVELVLGLPLD